MPSPPPRRPLSSSSGSGSSPPPRPPESPTEVLYNTAVQSFVRRDHLKTHAALARLLSTLKCQSRKQARRRWHDLSNGSSLAGTSSTSGGSTAGDSREADHEVEEWLIKTFKLYISAHASLYTDPPSSSSAGGALSPDLLALIPPHPPSKVLEHVTNTALQAYPDGILPPPVISTLVLASLKLQPADDALGYVHRVTEEWLANLPNAFMEGISVRERGGVSKRVEAGREGYLKVLELFTGEVLAREGEWEMARGILDGDTLMGSKRKEALYRHLRASQARREAPETASTSSSGFLPSPSSSLVLPDSSSHSSTATPQDRSRSRSSSASSSEATARPPSHFPLSSTGASLGRHISSTFRHPLAGNAPSSKGKGKAESVTTTSESTLPSKIVVNPPGSGSGSGRGNGRGDGRRRDSLIRNKLLSMVNFGFLPASIRNRLWGLSTTQLASLVLPFPLIGLLLLYAAIRRRRTSVVGSAGVAVMGAQNGVEDIRARLLAARRQGLWAWLVWFVRWWMGKVAGVWRLGTTITYV